MPTIFCLIILFCIWLTYERKKHAKMEEDAKEAFFELEKKASIARKKDISNLDYITIPLTSLPLTRGTDETINGYIDSLYAISEKPIVNLSKFSNTELKLAYGIANFEQLSEYDENYYTLTMLLSKWGSALFEKKKLSEARTVLEYALSIGTDLSSSIYTLASLYAELEDEEGFSLLRSHILTHCPNRSETMLAQLEKLRYYPYLA